MINFPPPPLDSAKRLTIMILLERHVNIIFSDLYRSMKITKGALDSHLKSLERDNYIIREVRFINTQSRVYVSPTPEGLLALKRAKIIWINLLK